MGRPRTVVLAVVALVVLTTAGCGGSDSSEIASGDDPAETAEQAGGSETGSGSTDDDAGAEALAADGSEDEGGGPGAPLGPDDALDEVRSGARLVLSYDAGQDAFVGQVENASEGFLAFVQVEIQLSTGQVLGPTDPVDLDVGASYPLSVPAGSAAFDTWTATPLIGSPDDNPTDVDSDGDSDYSGGY